MKEDPTHPLSLRISITAACQFRCMYCVGADTQPPVPVQDEIAGEDIARFVRVTAHQFGLSKVHVTGGEPLLRDDVVRIVDEIADVSPPDLALTTNGQYLADMAKPLKDAGLHRVNVSVDSLDADRYSRLNGVGAPLERTLRGIDEAQSAGLKPVKINTVALRGWNLREATRLVQWAMNMGCVLRFIELMPLGCLREDFDDLYVPAHAIKEKLEEDFILSAMSGARRGSSRYYRVEHRQDGQSGTIGFISPVSHPFCDGCRRLRLRSDGRLLGCMKQSDGPSIQHVLRRSDLADEQALAELIRLVLWSKDPGRSFEDVQNLASTGG